jgi:serine/threonine protein kinase, bacterial
VQSMRIPGTLLALATGIAAAGCASSKPQKPAACRAQEERGNDHERGNPAIARFGRNGGAPERIIEGPNTGLCRPGAIAVGPGGEVFVLDQINYVPPNPAGGAATWVSRLLVFDSAASGDVAPIRSMVFAREWGRSVESLGLDQAGRLYILSAATIPVRGGAIWVYDARWTYSPKLIRVIEGAAGQLERPSSIAFDGRGNLYVTDNVESNTGQVLVYGGEAQLGDTPLRKIAGPKTQLRLPIRLAIGAGDTLYVLNAFEIQRRRRCGFMTSPYVTITLYAPGADGEAEPVRSIRLAQGPGRDVVLGTPRGMDVDAEGAVYVWAARGGALIYAPGVSGTLAPSRIIAPKEWGDGDPVGVTRGNGGRIYQSYQPGMQIC